MWTPDKNSDKMHLCLVHLAVSQIVSEHSSLDKNLTKYIFVLSISWFLNRVWAFFTGQEFDKIYLCVGLLNRVWAMCQRLLQYSHSQHQQWYWENWESQERQIPGKCQLVHTRIYKEGLTERAIILCKLNKSLLENSISVGIHRQKCFFT